MLKNVWTIAFTLGLTCVGSWAVSAQESSSLRWVAASNGRIPRGAVVGGQESNRPLYICRATHNNGLHPGKLVQRNCNIGWGGKEVLKSSYEVLVAAPGSRLRWVNASEGEIPPDAIVGGLEGQLDLYLCRAQYKGGLHPGKVIDRNCNISWGGQEVLQSNYQVPVLETP